MKKLLILFALLLATAFSYSQKLTVNESGNVFDSQNNKWTVTEVRDILYTNPKALELYKEGREKKTWGNVLIFGGLTAVATNVVINATTDNVKYEYGQIKRSEQTFVPAIIGAAMIVVGIPVKIGHTKRVKKAIEMHNNGLNQTTAKVATQLTFLASSNQVGFKLQF